MASTPRRVHLEMVGAVVAGDGLERVAEVAGTHAGAPGAGIVPRLGAPVEAGAPYERYVASRRAGGSPRRPLEVTAEVPIFSGDAELGAVLLLGPGAPEAGEYLHVAAIAALTEVAVAEARDETEQTLRGSFLEELLTRDDLGSAIVVFVLVAATALPPAVPFVLIADPVVALRVSNVVLVALLFVAGFYWARSIGGNGWRTGTVLLLSGVLLVGIAIVFGG